MQAYPALLILLGFAALWAPAPVTRPYEQVQVHMGVPVRIVAHVEDEAAARDAVQAAYERIALLDRMLSDYRPDSEARALEAARGARTPVSGELFAVLTRAVDVARKSGGAFDPTVAPLVSLWREARTTRRLPDAATLAAARARVGWQRIELDLTLRPAHETADRVPTVDQVPPTADTRHPKAYRRLPTAHRHAVRLPDGMRLDLGGIAKGYILQDARHVLASRGVHRALLEAGGDIVVGDAPPGREGWRIDVRGTDRMFAERASRLTNAAIATSGPTAQFVEIDGTRYAHVIDPRTGLGVTAPFVAHVIGDDAATVDALATALAVLGPDGLSKLRRHFPALSFAIAQ